MTTLSIPPIDFDSIDRVPESHLWSQTNEVYNQTIRNHDIDQESLIPIIDLAHPKAMDLIGQACKQWGMFQVINHGVPLDLVKEVESEVYRLFELPAHKKWKVLRSEGRPDGYGPAFISPHFDKSMWYEGFHISNSLFCVENAKILWPHDFQSFCDTMDAYRNQMKFLSQKLSMMILQTLDATREEMNWATLNSEDTLHLNSYPSCPNPSSVISLASHTDSRLLTILNQTGGINGLEIFVEESGWSPVRPVENAFVVNIGDLLHMFSNATFPAVYHRVMVNKSNHRTSVAYFYSPSFESVVGPSSKFKNNPCFKSLSVKEYASLKGKNYNEALSMVRKKA